MTESDWLACQKPPQMLRMLDSRGKLSDRKARLFGVAVCRRIWHLLTDPSSRQAVELTERVLEGEVSQEVLDSAALAAEEVCKEASREAEDEDTLDDRPALLREAAGEAAHACSVFAFEKAAGAAAAAVALAGKWEDGKRTDAAERAAQAAILRDIFPSPFRPTPTLPPAFSPGTPASS
jgi:hypothetical protein